MTSRDDPTAHNRADWNAYSDEYQTAHGPVLGDAPDAWGCWRVPETELGVLGEVADRDVLELGCGAAQWTASLALRGARAVGIDLSERQLAHARRLLGEAGVSARLVHGSAERLPFRAACFDVVFCDHGAMSFARPEHTIAQAARVLRPGGLFAFCTSTPIRDIALDPESGFPGTSLTASYFDLYRFEDEGSICYQLAYGAWIRTFRRHGFIVDDLIEIRPGSDATTTYSDYVTPGWARQWPAEHVWKLTRQG